MPGGNDLISTCNLQTDIINDNSHSLSEALESLSESSSSFRGLQHPTSGIHKQAFVQERLLFFKGQLRLHSEVVQWHVVRSVMRRVHC